MVEKKNVADKETAEAAKSRKIMELNDRFRRTFQGGRVMLTQGIRNLDEKIVAEILEKVRGFDDFNPGNDPYGEHDFGAVEVAGIKCFWKIDYYDTEMRIHSPDASNPEVTFRVMTIMLAGEW